MTSKRTAVINITMGDKSFSTSFPIEPYIKEYQIADEAYRLAMLFADTQIMARYGHKLSSKKLSNVLQELDYTYEIKEEKVDEVYHIYANIDNSPIYQYSHPFSTREEAIEAAKDCAEKLYKDSPEVPSYQDIKERYCREHNIGFIQSLSDEIYEIIDSIYRDEVTKHINYFVTTNEEDTNHEADCPF